MNKKLQELLSKLHNSEDKNSFISSLKSLLTEIEENMENETESKESKHLLNSLYGAVLSNLNAFENYEKHISMVSLKDFFKNIRNHILKLNGTEDIIPNIDYLNQIKNGMYKKVKSTDQFIEKKLILELEGLLVDNENEILELVEDAKIEEYKKALLLQQLSKSMQLISFSVAFFNSIGLKLCSIYDYQNKKIPASDPSSKMSRLRKAFQYKHSLLKKQLNDIERHLGDYLKEDAFVDFIGVKQEVIELKSKTNKYMSSDGIPDPNLADDLRKGFKEFLGRKKSALEAQNAIDDPVFDKRIRKLHHIMAIVEVDNVPIKFYNKIRKNETKLREMSEIISVVKFQTKTWKSHEQSIQNGLTKKIWEIETTIKKKNQYLARKSAIELDTNNWDIQSTLKDVKRHLLQRIIEHNVIGDLKLTIDKLGEGLGISIDIHDRIIAYLGKANLVNFINKINADRLQEQQLTVNASFRNIFKSLLQNIQENVILELYGAALHSHNQHRFPFDFMYSSKYELINSLKFEQQPLTQNALDKMAELEHEIESTKSILGPYDAKRYVNVTFDSTHAILRPFYVWKSNEYKNEITKLLSGEEITIKADITKGLRDSLVKFKRIAINLKSQNKRIQTDLDTELRHFSATLTMVGNCYYRCGNIFFYTSSDDDVVFNHRFKKKSNEQLKGQKFFMKHIIERTRYDENFLSPYAMWSIKLENMTGDYGDLNKFSDEILDLELTGTGSLITRDAEYTHEICNRHLGKFFSIDNTIIDTEFETWNGI